MVLSFEFLSSSSICFSRTFFCQEQEKSTIKVDFLRECSACLEVLALLGRRGRTWFWIKIKGENVSRFSKPKKRSSWFEILDLSIFSISLSNAFIRILTTVLRGTKIMPCLYHVVAPYSPFLLHSDYSILFLCFEYIMSWIQTSKDTTANNTVHIIDRSDPSRLWFWVPRLEKTTARQDRTRRSTVSKRYVTRRSMRCMQSAPCTVRMLLGMGPRRRRRWKGANGTRVCWWRTLGW